MALTAQNAGAFLSGGMFADSMSWIITGMLVLFLIAALRYRKNSRYFSIMLHDMLEVRERHNAFDDTLRETAFLWLLNLLWCCSAGIFLYGLLNPPSSGLLFVSADVEKLGICFGVAVVYTLFLTIAYWFVGNLFSDGPKASMWVKGYLSTQGLEAILLFPMALLAGCIPGSLHGLLIAAAVIFVLAKILFIYKGFCIFFTEIASWVLFLYYLCSLEIVPVVLAYVAALYFG